MKKLLALVLCGLTSWGWAADIDKATGLLEGFEYDNVQMPDGTEWQSPERLSLNKLQPTAYMFHFADGESAKSVMPEKSQYYKSLDGTWKFHWVAKPDDRPAKFYETSYDVTSWDDIEVPGCWNVQGLGKHGEMKYGVPLYVNQPVMFYHEVKVGDWKEGVMRQPKDQRYTTYKYPNEVGSYRRTFSVPAGWQGRNIILNFDGVDSFFYLWINGKYVGFSKNSRNTASFDITPYINNKGENVVAVEVYRSSDGSFLEAQDMFRLPGIFRSTYLTSTPSVKIEDLVVRTKSVDSDKASVTVDLCIADNGKKKQKEYNYDLSIYPVKLYSDQIVGTEPVSSIRGGMMAPQPNDGVVMGIEKGLKLWSAEAPHRYVLVAELKDKKGRTIDCVSTYFGVCKVEIKDTKAEDDEFGLAGRYFYVNNKPVKLKGVNRHETSLDRGHAITHEQMEEEVMLMKRGNINHIRMSHYSNDPYMYYLCDKYGIYLEDECNLESHQYYYGDASLSHPKEWKAAHVARNMEMVHGHINHPSIVIWSLGNEAGPGDNFKAAYEAIKAFDKSRPVQYERNNNIVDMGSNQYPSVAWVQQVAKGKSNVKYPYHISEYAHSMGNSLGNLVDYWDAMESTNFFCGGAIWDWVDQAIDTYTPEGIKYMGYGGDHGDWPNDGMFCMNGIMLPDLTPKPQYFEVKKVYQNVGVTLEEVKDVPKGTPHSKEITIKVFNKNYFEPITPNTYDISAIPIVNGEPLEAITLELDRNIAPRQSQTFKFYLGRKCLAGELYLNVEFRLAEQKPWARAGYVQMAEQLFICNNTQLASLSEATTASTIATVLASTIVPEASTATASGAASTTVPGAAPATVPGASAATVPKAAPATVPDGSPSGLKLTRGGTETCVSGPNFVASFDDSNGSLSCLSYGGQYLIESGNGPKLDAFRAPVDNDNWAWNAWFQNGLYDLQHRTTSAPIIMSEKDGTITIIYNVESRPKTKGRAIHRPGKAGEPFERIESTPLTEGEGFSFTTTQRYTVYPDGTISLASSIVSSDPSIALPRLGYALKMPTRYDQYQYYGRGPLNNYADRKTGSFVGIYKSTVKEQFVNFPKPQSMGNREGVRWAAVTDAQGTGLQFIADQPMTETVNGITTNSRWMSVSVLPWSALQMTLAAHPHELPESDGIYVHLDCQVTGLGGNSCGQGGPLSQDRVQGSLHQMKLIISPVRRGADLSERALVTSKGLCPVSISRDRAGNVSIVGDNAATTPSTLCYQVTEPGKKPGKVQKHDTANRMPCIVPFRNGGTITAWYEGDEKAKTTATYSKIETVPVEVVYVSSEEGPSGEVARNIVDGDPATIWHTMYSITMGTYPHWLDFDCNEVKTIKGFTYLPRQDGGENGNIKGYKLQLSLDGKTWTDAVATGNFENNLKEKKVLLQKPQKARYLRFTATSSQNGAEFASGAEFTVIAE